MNYSSDEEDYCPLCIEVMDITDKNFKPCPCGYQICQFCYNNIRNNPELNGNCPACRRKYDDESVEYKVLSPEEIKLEHAKQARREREKKQREKEKKDHEAVNRRHLAGMRVIQKNLVYVVGLNPPVAFEELIPVLKSDRYFGQYGRILKCVVNKKGSGHTETAASNYTAGKDNITIYVTFAKKEDATKCINAIDGTYVDGRMLKAAYGTTKYCSSYLRGQPCPNPNCMFLHEPGEEADSYTRKDLSRQQKEGSPFRHVAPPAVPAAVNGTYHPPGSQPQAAVETPEPESSVSTPVLTNVVPAVTTTNAWGAKVAAAQAAAASQGETGVAFPTLVEAIATSSTPQPQQSKKNKNSAQFQIDEYDSAATAQQFIHETMQSLSSYAKIKMRVRKVNTEGYPLLFGKIADGSDGLRERIVDMLTTRPVHPLEALAPYLNNGTQQVHLPQQVPVRGNVQTPPPGLFVESTSASQDLLQQLMSKRVSA